MYEISNGSLQKMQSLIPVGCPTLCTFFERPTYAALAQRNRGKERKEENGKLYTIKSETKAQGRLTRREEKNCSSLSWAITYSSPYKLWVPRASSHSQVKIVALLGGSQSWLPSKVVRAHNWAVQANTLLREEICSRSPLL